MTHTSTPGMVPRRRAFTSAVTGMPAVTRFAAVAGCGLAALLAAWLLDGYPLSSLSRVMSLGLLAVSVAVLTTHAGLPSLGQVAPYAVGGYTTALVAKAGQTIGPVQLAAAAATAAVFSLLVGVAVIRSRGVVFLMVTLAVGVLVGTVADQWHDLTGGTDGLGGIPATRPWWGFGSLADDRAVYLYVLAVTALVLAAVGWGLRSPAGLLLHGCRDHETRMRASGHPVTAYLLAAYVAAGTIAGLGGALLVTAQRYISPHDIGFDTAALMLLAVAIGGSVGGTLIAVGAIVTVRDTASAWTPGQAPLLLGVGFLAAAFVPRTLPWLAARIRPHATPKGEKTS